MDSLKNEKMAAVNLLVHQAHIFFELYSPIRNFKLRLMLALHACKLYIKEMEQKYIILNTMYIAPPR